MKIKRLCAAFLAAVVCMSVFSTTAFAYTDETAASSAETVETAPAETTEQETEEVPYSVSVDEDGTVVFSFNGEDWKYDTGETEDDCMGTGKVVTNGSRLNVRTGAGMDYEIIDQLRPGEEVKVIGVDGDWYQITVPEKNGYVHSDYLEMIEEAEQNSEMDMALLMMFMNMFMQNMDTGADASESALTPDGNLTLVDVVACARQILLEAQKHVDAHSLVRFHDVVEHVAGGIEESNGPQCKRGDEEVVAKPRAQPLIDQDADQDCCECQLHVDDVERNDELREEQRTGSDAKDVADEHPHALPVAAVDADHGSREQFYEQ